MKPEVWFIENIYENYKERVDELSLNRFTTMIYSWKLKKKSMEDLYDMIINSC